MSGDFTWGIIAAVTVLAAAYTIWILTREQP
jgi:hypothetical protein